MCHRCCRFRAAGTGYYGRPTGRQEDSPFIPQCLEFCPPCFTLLIVVLLPIMAVYRRWLWFDDSFVFTLSSGDFDQFLADPCRFPGRSKAVLLSMCLIAAVLSQTIPFGLGDTRGEEYGMESPVVGWDKAVQRHRQGTSKNAGMHCLTECMHTSPNDMPSTFCNASLR